MESKIDCGVCTHNALCREAKTPLLCPSFEKEYKTGDILAFSGTGPTSWAIRAVTGSAISHVGVVLVLGGITFICESTTLVDMPDYFTKTCTKGVQLQIAQARIQNYNGAVFHYRLTEEVSKEAMQRGVDWLISVHRQKVPYDIIQAIGAGIDVWDKFTAERLARRLDKFGLDGISEIFANIGMENKPDFSSLFCSELCGKFFQEIGLLPEDYNPSEATPVDICELPFVKFSTQEK